ncbi:MAG: TrmB family transcriptional regulator [Peptostreptococcaceae bacterium]|nr:TrmB family transcriptional regulator [Peptostreptococcaceae bacterium]
MELIQLMTQLNLTRQEATIYVALLTEGELNGYEAAKVTGISRSNAYNSLSSLVEKGGTFILEGQPVKYSPVSLEEFCDNQIRRLVQTKTQIMKLAPEKRREVEGYITIKGETHILNKARHMISEAKERVYISVSDQILETVMPDIQSAIERGIKMVLITNPPVTLANATVYYGNKNLHQIGLIADSANVLTGDIEDGENSTCLYSQKKNLVDLFKESMKNEIKLIEIMKGKEII